jgi:Na+/proline symporter
MNVNRMRWELIGVLAAAAIVTGIGTNLHNAVIGWVGFVLFFCAVALFLRWRRAALAERRARVFDREAKTDETRTRPDQ